MGHGNLQTADESRILKFLSCWQLRNWQGCPQLSAAALDAGRRADWLEHEHAKPRTGGSSDGRRSCVEHP
jgi:hypothetical protein